MGLLQNLQVFVIKLVCWLGWLSSFALAQSQLDISEATSGFVTISVQGLTCLSNMAVFVTSLIRGRLDLEMGARDALEILVSAKLKTINGIEDGNGLITEQTASAEQGPLQKMFESFGRLLHGLGIQKMVDFFRRLRHRLGIQKMVELFRRLRHRVGIHIPCFREEDLETASAGRRPSASNENGSVQNASVVMLSNGKPNWSIKEFMKTNAPIADSILLRFLPLQDAINDGEVVTPEVTIQMCGCNYCNCIVFWTIEEITNMLSLQMPGTFKRLSNSLCLLPCLTCLTNGCHGCNWDSLLPLVQDDEGYKVRVNESKVVSEILDDISARSINGKGHICICIPLNDAGRDKWTELLVRSLRSKDAENRGVRVMASEALEDYLAGRPTSSRSVEDNTVEYNMVSFIIPRLTEVFINILLTFMFGVDGFSSSLVARRTVRDYLVDSKGSGFAANAFLTKAVVKSDFQVVSQVLTFRGDLLGIKTLSFIICCVNLICSIAWAVLMTAIPPSENVLLAITVAVGIAWCMDSIIILTRLTSIGLRLLYIIFVCMLILSPFLLVTAQYFSAQLCVILLVIVWPSSNWRDKMFLSVIFLIWTTMGLSMGVPLLVKLSLLLIALCIIALAWLWFNSMERLFSLVMILELAYVQLILNMYGVNNSGWDSERWVYGAIQILVWVKWTGGSYILSKKNSLEFLGKSPHEWGLLLYSSAFFLNAVLAGVLSEWKTPWIYSISREHHHRNTTILAGVRSNWGEPWIYSISREHHHRNTTTEGVLSATP